MYEISFSLYEIIFCMYRILFRLYELLFRLCDMISFEVNIIRLYEILHRLCKIISFVRSNMSSVPSNISFGRNDFVCTKYYSSVRNYFV